MIFAYADPPYLGQCGKHYSHHHPDGRCWDKLETHQLLIERLTADYPDGWALSATSPSLRELLPLTPPKTRIAAWVKPYATFKPGVRPCYAWEPVLFSGGRKTGFREPEKYGGQVTPMDSLFVRATQERGLAGAKPAVFCRWVLDLLGYVEGDAVDDLFPGTFSMGREQAQGVLL